MITHGIFFSIETHENNWLMVVTQDLLDSTASSMNKRGDFLLAVGSPFGVLSPTHFLNRYYILFG